jgi:hypothetical protein
MRLGAQLADPAIKAIPLLIESAKTGAWLARSAVALRLLVRIDQSAVDSYTFPDRFAIDRLGRFLNRRDRPGLSLNHRALPWRGD